MAKQETSPLTANELRDRIAVAIDEAGTGETAYSREYGTVDIAADPGDLADAVLAEVVGPELNCRDELIEKLTAKLDAAETNHTNAASNLMDLLNALGLDPYNTHINDAIAYAQRLRANQTGGAR